MRDYASVRRLVLSSLLALLAVALGVGASQPAFRAENPLLFDPAWSPDGKWIAFSGGPFGEPTGIFVVRPVGRNLTRLTPKTIDAAGPVWSPTGSGSCSSRARQASARTTDASCT
jgi:hypothetical protein